MGLCGHHRSRSPAMTDRIEEPFGPVYPARAGAGKYRGAAPRARPDRLPQWTAP